MNNIKIMQGIIIKDNQTNIKYRIINVKSEYIVLINMDTMNHCDIIRLNNIIVYNKISNETFSIINEPNNTYIIDEETLPEHTRVKFKRNKTIIDTINKIYAPDYIELTQKRNKPIIEELIQKSGLTRAAVWRIIIKYLQSGCKESSLLRTRTIPETKNQITKNKRGRVSKIAEHNGKNLTEEDHNNMAIYIKKYLTNKLITIQKCYDDMINKYYTEVIYENGIWHYEEFPANKKPSIHQFKYYLKKTTKKEERRAAKIGRREFRNQKRILTGTALNNVYYPGNIVELDACELDISVVSLLDRTKAVGSPVAYFMIDIYSRLILAASLSFENNSIIAMTNCLASLVEDKEEILKKYGLTIIQTNKNLTLEDIMPSRIKPHIIRTDHGSDYISKEAQRIAKELSIELQYPPPGTGSLKSIVERSFRAFQKNFTDITLHKGTKDYTNGISKHNTEAKLTIEDVTCLMYSFILQHNSTQHNSEYNLTPDMVKNNVGHIPAEIWRYGIKHAGNPSYITDIEQYLYALLKPVKAKLKRTGINYKTLHYIPVGEDTETYNKMYETKTGSIPFSIRIDLRSIATVYYLDKNHKLHTAKLPDDDIHRQLAKMTWPEFETFLKEQKKLLAEKEVGSAITRRALRRINIETVRAAKTLSGNGKTEDKDMRKTRAKEKSRVSQELAFNNRFGLISTENKNLPEPTIDTKAKETVTNPNEKLMPDLNKMTEEEKQAYREELNNALILLAEDDI